MSKKAPIFSQRLLRAIKLGDNFFSSIKRADGNNYIIHLLGVMYIASTITNDEDVLIAAVLHDTLEDVDPEKYSEDEMRRDFGDRVVELVKTVSHSVVSSSIAKKQSRQIYLAQIEAGPKDALIISASDLINNLSDMIFNIESGDLSLMPESMRNTNDPSFQVRLWFYDQRVKIFLRRLGDDHTLALEALNLINYYKKLMEV